VRAGHSDERWLIDHWFDVRFLSPDALASRVLTVRVHYHALWPI